MRCKTRESSLGHLILLELSRLIIFISVASCLKCFSLAAHSVNTTTSATSAKHMPHFLLSSRRQTFYCVLITGSFSSSFPVCFFHPSHWETSMNDCRDVLDQRPQYLLRLQVAAGLMQFLGKLEAECLVISVALWCSLGRSGMRA